MHPERSGEYKVICKAVPFDYIIPGKQDEYEISLRVLRFKISDDGYENVITNLPVGQFSSVEIKKIYHLRWGIESLLSRTQVRNRGVKLSCEKPTVDRNGSMGTSHPL